MLEILVFFAAGLIALLLNLRTMGSIIIKQLVVH